MDSVNDVNLDNNLDSDNISYQKESKHEQSEYLLSPDKITRKRSFRDYENVRSTSHNITKQIKEDNYAKYNLEKRKRVNRMKVIIILAILLLFLLSMILNLVLIIKIYRIDKQLDKIYSYEESYISQDLI